MKKSMNSDKRRHTRSGVRVAQPHNLFFLETRAETYPITKIRDVSISGVGIETRRTFKTGERIGLRYHENDFDLTIAGTVIWCDPLNGDGRCSMGIEFDPKNAQDNSLFFLALRKYLDDFDGLYAEA